MNASWVSIDLMDFAVQTEEAVESAEKALKWLRSFRDTLLMEGRNSKPMPWAVELLKQADVKIAKKSIARMQGQVVKLCGKDCDIEEECVKRYGERYTSLVTLMNLTAEAPTREDGDFKSDSDDAGNLESDTSAEPLGGRGHSPESDSSALKPLPPSKPKKPKVEKHPHGEFQNVMLTDDEYIKACASVKDCDSMIERMSSYKASSGKKYKSDYAALLNWARRDDDRHSLPQAPMYKTAADRDREEIQKIADYYAAQERGEKPPMPKIQLVEGL